LKAKDVRHDRPSGSAPKGALNPELFYVAPDGAIMAVRVDIRASVWSAGSPEKVVEER